ncbi:MAG TPA: GTP pyrophosphokinase, partial [Desulfonauticus sp.]|nr:GTP pyrophosphokinase [Desulfonauticus sp.]
NRFLPKEEPSEKKEKEESVQTSSLGVKIKGIGDVLIRFAKCCSPVPGDPIIGYISRGRGVTIHTLDCPNVKRMEPERQLEVFWATEVKNTFPAKIKIICENKRGVLAKIANTLMESETDINSGSFHSNVDGKSEIFLTLMVESSAKLYKAISALQKISEVKEVSRLTMSERRG